MTANKFAKYYSYICVPITFTLFIFLYVNYYTSNNSLVGVLLSLLLTFLFPLLIFLYFKEKGFVKDYDASIKEERTKLYLYGIILTILGFIISYFFKLSNNFTYLWVIYTINTLLLILVNKYWKISAHLIGISAPMAILFYFNSVYTFVFIPLTIILAWARLKLKMHTKSQIFAGFLFGFLLTLIQLKLLIIK